MGVIAKSVMGRLKWPIAHIVPQFVRLIQIGQMRHLVFFGHGLLDLGRGDIENLIGQRHIGQT